MSILTGCAEDNSDESVAHNKQFFHYSEDEGIHASCDILKNVDGKTIAVVLSYEKDLEDAVFRSGDQYTTAESLDPSKSAQGLWVRGTRIALNSADPPPVFVRYFDYKLGKMVIKRMDQLLSDRELELLDGLYDLQSASSKNALIAFIGMFVERTKE